MDKITITLSCPVELRSAATGEVSQSWSEITLRKPLFGDLVDSMDAQGKGQIVMQLAERLSGVPAIALRKLDLTDGARVMEAVLGFLPSGLLTGSPQPNSSQAVSDFPAAGSDGDRRA